MNNKIKIKGVLFDMDGLLLDTESVGLICWQASCKDLGYELTDEMYKKLIGLQAQQSNKILIEFFGEDFPLETVREIKMKYYKEYKENNPINEKKGAKELLNFLNNNNIPCSLATSTYREYAIPSLKKVGLLDYFQATTTGDEVKNGKPSPDIFLLAAEKINIPANKCIILEDSFNGIKAAHAAQGFPIMIPDLIIPDDEIRKLTHRIEDSLLSVLDLIENQIIEIEK